MHLFPRLQQLRAIAPLLLLSALIVLSGCGYFRYTRNVTPVDDFTLSVSPASSTVVAGLPAAPYGFTISAAGNFSGQVTVSLKPPPGFSCVPASCSVALAAYVAPNSLQLTPSATTPAGAYPLNFVATSDTLSHTALATLTVVQPSPQDFSIAVTPTQSTVGSGSAAPPYSFVATPINGFNGTIVVSAMPPSGFTCAPVSCTVTLDDNQARNALQFTPAATTTGTFTLPFTATSGNISHTVNASITVQASDFSFAVSPTTSSATAGSAAPPYSFVATPINGFSGVVSVTTVLPSGFTCAPAACTAVLMGNQALNAIQITPPGTASGIYTVTFTATSGALSHQAAATLSVAATPPPPPTEACAVPAAVTAPSTTRRGFVYTGDPSPRPLVYDAARNRVLAVNQQFNEIDVLSPDTLSITARLPVPQPVGIDLSTDGKTLYIGTQTHYMYLATADTLCITSRPYTVGTAPYLTLSPQYPTALADGSVLVAAYDISTTAEEVLLWTPSTGFNIVEGLGPIATSVRSVIPSGDRMHAYLAGDDSGGAFGRYDVGSGASYKTVAFGTQPFVLAVNQDGSRVLIEEDCCSVFLTDSDFNTLATTTVSFVSHVIAEPDFSKIYASNSISPNITVFDGTLTPLGNLPAPDSQTYYLPDSLGVFDGEHRIAASSPGGVAFIPTSPLEPTPTAGTSLPTLAMTGIMYGAFQPADPEAGLTTTLNGSSFPSAPSGVSLSEGAVSHSAVLNSSTKNADSNDVENLTVPSFASGCADATATFPNSDAAFAPLAFCYSPAVFVVDGDSGPSTGGSTLTLYGLGFGPVAPQVTIGGVASPKVTMGIGYNPNGPLTLSNLQAVVPPGIMGDADISVVTPWATTTLPRAFHYAQRVDTALPSGAQPNQLILDVPRGRILITDTAHDRLLVYSLDTGAFEKSITTGPQPQGIGLTPDGSKLILLTAGDYKISTLDANSYDTLQQVTSPSTDRNVFTYGPVGPPIMVATMTGNKAYVVTEAGYLQGEAGAFSYANLYDFDLDTNTLTSDPLNLTFYNSGEGFYIASSLDGSTAMIGGSISQAVGNTLITPDIGVFTFDPTVSADGHVLSSGGVLLDQAGHWQTSTTEDTLLQGSAAFEEIFFNGAQFNSSASLLYRAAEPHVRIYDVHHGNLVRTLEIPGGVIGSNPVTDSSISRLLAVPPSGQQVIAATPNGVSIFTFASDPLSIGEANDNAGQLTLLGSGFSSDTSVVVDTLSASAAYVGSTQLNVTLPALASGPHSVTVANPNGDTYTLTLAFTTP